MTIKELLEKIMDKYLYEKKSKFPGEMFPILQEMTPLVFKLDLKLGGEYKVKLGIGQGNWAKIPWIAIWKDCNNTTPHSGYFVVILFKENMSGGYITLEQGVQWFLDTYEADYSGALYAMATHWVDKLKINRRPIYLMRSEATKLALGYETGQIHSYELKKGELNQAEILENIYTSLSWLDEIQNIIEEGYVKDENDNGKYEYKWEKYNKEFIKNKLGI